MAQNNLLTDQQLVLKRWLNHEENIRIDAHKIEYLEPPIIEHDTAYCNEFMQRFKRLGNKPIK